MNQHNFYTPEEFDSAAIAATQSIAARGKPGEVLRMLHQSIGGTPFGTWTDKTEAQEYTRCLQSDWKCYVIANFREIDSDAVRLHYDEGARAEKTRKNARALFVARLMGEKLVSGQQRKAMREALSTSKIEGATINESTKPSDKATELTEFEANLIGWAKSLNRGNRAVLIAAMEAYDEGNEFILSIRTTPQSEGATQTTWSPDDVAETLRGIANAPAHH